MKEHFQHLQRAGIINEFLANKMISMVGFRNVAVHDYESIDPEILKSILKRHVTHIEEFYTTVLKYYSFA